MTAAGSTLPFVFITAIDDEAVKTAAIQLGCVVYLRKPFPAKLLINAVAYATGGLSTN